MDSNEFVESLREFISILEPKIRDAESVEQIEDQILHLEASDRKFHKYEIVKQIKRKIHEKLEPVWENSLEQRTHHGSSENLVQAVTDDVLKSKEFVDLTKNLRVKITDAVDTLCQSMSDDLLVQDSFGFTGGFHYPGRAKKSTTSTASGISMVSFGSSLNPPGFFLNQEQAAALTAKLEKSKSIETRREAMNKLLHLAPLECVDWDQWSTLQNFISDALSDKDEELSMFALRFCARGLSTLTAKAKEIYILLVRHLVGVFLSKRSIIPKRNSSVNASSKSDLSKYFRTFRLLNQFQQEVPTFWVRFSERMVDEVVRCTVELLAVSSSSDTLTPLHFMALVDPQARWFKQWIHGFYSRNYLLSSLKANKGLVVMMVQHLFTFAQSRIRASQTADSENTSRVAYGSNELIYSSDQVDFLTFVYCCNTISKLLLYVNGREIFPVQIEHKNSTVDVIGLLRMLIVLMLRSAPSSPTRIKGEELDPARLVRDMLIQLASAESTCCTCLCSDKVTSALIKPIHDWLDDAKDKNNSEDMSLVSERALMYVADVLSTIASSSVGKHHLLYGEVGARYVRSRSSVVHVIAEFSQKALAGTLPTHYRPSPSCALTGAYVYICRQLYSCAEGLHALLQFKLHDSIAQGWRDACAAVDDSTPTPSLVGSEEDDEHTTAAGDRTLVMWEETLRDNLLNFSATPRGILLVQQTGALQECVSYMYARYAKKMQVSKNEKFGYGTMVTQVAAAAPGMKALQKTGFLGALLKEVWYSLEIPPEGVSFLPRAWPVTAIDRAAHKPLITLLNVLSAFPAVYEVLQGTESKQNTKYDLSFRRFPKTVAELIERLVLLDSPEKVHYLFNPEQSHVFGLRVLSCMVSCLDSYLILESQFGLQEVLLQLQKENRLDATGDILIDMCSVERNYLLVKIYLVGGASERKLPRRDLETASSKYSHQLFSAYPVPREYVPKASGSKSAVKPASGTILKSLSEPAPEGSSVMENLRQDFTNVMLKHPEQLTSSVMFDILERCVKELVDDPTEAIFPLMEYAGTDNALKSIKLSAAHQLGVELAIRYGVQLRLVSSLSEAGGNLTHLLKQCALFLRQQQRPATSQLQTLQTDYPGFDWFASSVFLMAGGARDKAWSLLHQFTALVSSAYLWLPRLHNSMHLSPALMQSGIPLLFSSTGHNVELLLQAELPLVASAFQMSGYTPAQICCHWLRQCFWNYLDWPEICAYLTTCVLLGIDFQVYTCIAVLKHLEKEILLHHQQQDLVIFLKEEAIKDFKISKYLRYMLDLKKRFRSLVLMDMQNQYMV